MAEYPKSRLFFAIVYFFVNLNNKRYLLFQGETNDWDLNQSAERLLTEKFEANQKDEFIIVDKAKD